MTGELREKLLKLVNDTNSAVDVARNHIQDAVNWGDVECIAAAQVFGIIPTGETYACWSVTIEEASPMAYAFQAFVSGQLTLAGWHQVNVITAW